MLGTIESKVKTGMLLNLPMRFMMSQITLLQTQGDTFFWS